LVVPIVVPQAPERELAVLSELQRRGEDAADARDEDAPVGTIVIREMQHALLLAAAVREDPVDLVPVVLPLVVVDRGELEPEGPDRSGDSEAALRSGRRTDGLEAPIVRERAGLAGREEPVRAIRGHEVVEPERRDAPRKLSLGLPEGEPVVLVEPVGV